MNLYYINHLNERLDLDTENIILQYQELFDYSWDVESDNDRIMSFSRKSATIPVTVTVTADTPEEYVEILARFHRTVEKDVLAMTPGRLHLGDQYLICYISGDIKQDAFMGVPIQVKNLSLVTDYPFWIKEQAYTFKPRGDHDPGDLEFPFDCPFDLMGDAAGIGVINLDHYAACDFLITVYGPCTNPRIVISGNIYEVRTKLDAGEYMQIDSRSFTITRVKVGGQKVNEFDNRNSSSGRIFKKISPGYNLVSWDGSFGFDVTLYVERSEPLWITDS